MNWKFWATWVGGVLGVMLVGALVLLLVQKFIGHPEREARLSYTFQDWTMDCAPLSAQKGGCSLTEELFAQDGESIARLTYVRNEKDEQKIAIVVPHGVLLEPGLGFSVGKDTVKPYPYETCDNNGCLVLVPVDDSMRTALFANQSGRIVLMPPEGKKPIGFTYSLKGFADGLKALEADRRRRTAWWRFLVG